MERIVVAISLPSIFTLSSLAHSLRSFASFTCFAGQVLRLPTSGFFGVYHRLCSGYGVGLVWVWCGFGVGLVWVWCGFGVGLVWVWCGFGVGLVWVWSGFGVGLVWVWCGFGVGLVWVWCGFGVGLVWVWSGFGLGIERSCVAGGRNPPR